MDGWVISISNWRVAGTSGVSGVDNQVCLETKFTDDEISHETYKRQLEKTEADLHRIAIDMVRLDGSRGSNINEMEQLLLLSRDIRKAFAEAPHDLRRTYLALFWEKIVVKDRNISSKQYPPYSSAQLE